MLVRLLHPIQNLLQRSSPSSETQSPASLIHPLPVMRESILFLATPLLSSSTRDHTIYAASFSSFPSLCAKRSLPTKLFTLVIHSYDLLLHIGYGKQLLRPIFEWPHSRSYVIMLLIIGLSKYCLSCGRRFSLKCSLSDCLVYNAIIYYFQVVILAATSVNASIWED